MYAIKTTSLTKCYGEKAVVDHIDLSIREGELFALLGMNGAGKTTTIKMLTGLIAPTSGDGEILGSSILQDVQRVKSYTNVSPQETAVARNLTVRENLELMAGIYGSSRRAAKEKAEEMVQQLHMQDVKHTKAKHLSGGWQRRLSIAMALVSEPKVLFLDEPTLGLDVLARRELWDFICGLKGKITIILTTHYLEEAVALSDRIGILAEGKLKACGTVEEMLKLTGEQAFEEAFIKLAGGAR